MASLTPIEWENVVIDERSHMFVTPYVSFYSGKMSFNAKMFKEANLVAYTHVSLRFAHKHRQIALTFHNRGELTGAHKLIRRYMHNKDDLGGKIPNGAGVKIGRLLSAVEWLRQTITETKAAGGHLNFVPLYDEETNSWIISIKPILKAAMLQKDFLQALPSSNNLIGAYVLYDELGKVVYVGEGYVAIRVRAHIAAGYDFLKVSYVKLDDKELCKPFQDDLLEEIVLNTGRLPRYNKQGAGKPGARPSK